MFNYRVTNVGGGIGYNVTLQFGTCSRMDTIGVGANWLDLAG